MSRATYVPGSFWKRQNGTGDVSVSHISKSPFLDYNEMQCELEELISRTIKSDENRDSSEEASENIRNAGINIAEEKLLKEEDEIFNDRLDMLDEFISDNGKTPDDEAVINFNQLVSEFGEEELERLEEEISELEKTEFIDPHMDEKKFERLKIKHKERREQSASDGGNGLP